MTSHLNVPLLSPNFVPSSRKPIERFLEEKNQFPLIGFNQFLETYYIIKMGKLTSYETVEDSRDLRIPVQSEEAFEHGIEFKCKVFNWSSDFMCMCKRYVVENNKRPVEQ